MDWAKLEQAVRKAIDDRDARNSEQRARVYAAARAALGRRQDVDGDTLARFDVLAETIEAAYAPEALDATSRPWLLAVKWNSIRQWLLFPVGIVVGAAALLFFDAMTAHSISVDKMEALRDSYKATQPQVPVAIEFLHEIADAVIKAQGDDRKKFDATKVFVPLAKFDADLAKKLPRSLPKGSAVILKADAFNFKILFNWPLCGTVSISNPDMVDPVRALPNSIGCPNFGLWTSGAGNW